MRFEVRDSPLGRMLVAATAAGVCSILLGDRDDDLIAWLRDNFPHAQISAAQRGDSQLQQWADAVLSTLGDRSDPIAEPPLDLAGTPFQRRVWNALHAIPRGETRSYQQIARSIGQPAACRAVAGACGANPAALIIPCHRVIREDGGLGGFACGIERKKWLLKHEAGC